jgi:hypothetical protein
MNNPLVRIKKPLPVLIFEMLALELLPDNIHIFCLFIGSGMVCIVVYKK